jgi:hypothetical protein
MTVCVSVFLPSYLACKTHALYYVVICGVSDCTLFSTLSPKRHDFRRKFMGSKMSVLIFCVTLKHFSLLEELSEILS